MRALGVIFGALLGLLALFTGGCSLGFIGALLLEPGGGGDQEIIRIAGVGAFVTPFLILFAWLLMRTPDSLLDPEVAAQRISVERFLGGVVCTMLALLMVGEVIFLLLFADELDMGDVPTTLVAIYAVIGLAGIWGAKQCFQRKRTA